MEVAYIQSVDNILSRQVFVFEHPFARIRTIISIVPDIKISILGFAGSCYLPPITKVVLI